MRPLCRYTHYNHIKSCSNAFSSLRYFLVSYFMHLINNIKASFFMCWCVFYYFCKALVVIFCNNLYRYFKLHASEINFRSVNFACLIAYYWTPNHTCLLLSEPMKLLSLRPECSIVFPKKSTMRFKAMLRTELLKHTKFGPTLWTIVDSEKSSVKS